MNTKSQITEYYTTARLLVRQGNAKGARYYVLKILNAGLEIYKSSTDILSQVKNKAFLERWVAVSRDLYSCGITDYVLECFALSKTDGLQKTAPANSAAKKVKAEKSAPDGGVDMAGLISGTDEGLSWQEKVFSENKCATVEISCSLAGGVTNGTGFVISPNGYLLTNDHVVFNEEKGIYYPKLVMSVMGESKKYPVEVLFSDEKSDVALCKFDPAAVNAIKYVKRIADYSKVQPAQKCLIIGNAFGMGLAPLTGEIRFAKNKSGNLVHTAPSNPGDSGGPVFNRHGECIGINKSKTVAVNGAAASGFANATPMDKIEELLKKWTENNNIKL